MAQRGSSPLPWYPKGASDTLDGSQTFPGAMASLSDLIPDPTTPDLWQCRPASVVLGNLSGAPFSSGFSSGFQFMQGAGFISAMQVIGNFVYGMVATTLTPGFDQPFCFNLTTGLFVAVTGITGANVPASPPVTGAWTPPIMDVIGSKLIVTHLGFAATANFFGWFDISVPSAPVWHAGNLTGAIAFATVPTGVAQFNGRAYFIVNTIAQPAIVFSDILNPLNVTNATQVLTFGDLVPLTVLGQLKLYNQLGGIVQGLAVFKGVSNVYQITGDSALNNLFVNASNIATGTLCPLGIASTSKGLAFVSPDGVRVIDYTFSISDPIGKDGSGITVPFISTVIPTRVCAAAAGDVLRISTQNGAAINTPFQEWWYDFGRKVWSGPHTFPASLIDSYQNSFIVSPVGVLASLWRSDVTQSVGSVFIENGMQMKWTWQTAYLPDTQQMVNCSMSFALLNIALPSAVSPVNVSALNSAGAVLDTVQIALTASQTIWGNFNWGAALWGSALGSLVPRQLPWHRPIVFSKMAIQATGQSNAAIKIGGLFMRYKILRYLTDIGAVA